MEDRSHACIGCTETFATSRLAQSVKEARAVAGLAGQRKRSKYENLARTHNFIPVVVMTSGAFCTEALFAEIGRRIHAITNEAKSRAFLIQQIFVALQCGNAALVLGTTGPVLSGDTQQHCHDLRL